MMFWCVLIDLCILERFYRKFSFGIVVINCMFWWYCVGCGIVFCGKWVCDVIGLGCGVLSSFWLLCV